MPGVQGIECLAEEVGSLGHCHCFRDESTARLQEQTPLCFLVCEHAALLGMCPARLLLRDRLAENCVFTV